MRCNIPANDLGQRLNDTICRYRGQPVRVRHAGGDNLEIFNIHNKRNIGVIKTEDEALDISSIPLGYVQISPDTVVYTSRKAARIYKQGVTQDCLVMNWLTPAKSRSILFSIYSQAFENMILDVYPSLEDAQKLLRIPRSESKTTEIAISREVALSYDHDMQFTYVYFKARKVGYIIKDQNTVITPSSEDGWLISRHLSSFNWKVE